MICLGFGYGTFNIAQGLGYIKIKNTDDMDETLLARKKKSLLFIGCVMLCIGVIYTLDFMRL